MRIGSIMIFVGIIMMLCSMSTWIIENGTFAITGAIGLSGMVISMLGLIIYAFEIRNIEQR